MFISGTFGLPFGMYISQQVHLVNGQWNPNSDFLSPNKHILKEIVSKAIEVINEYDLGKRINKNSKRSQLQEERVIDSMDWDS